LGLAPAVPKTAKREVLKPRFIALASRS
jgi:hypothetical protein